MHSLDRNYFMMVIDNKFEIGQLVYLKTDEEQKERMVVNIIIGPNDTLRYLLCLAAAETWHYEMEITHEKNVLV